MQGPSGRLAMVGTGTPRSLPRNPGESVNPMDRSPFLAHHYGLSLLGGDWNMAGLWLSIYWEQSSHLTFIFFRGVETTNQITMVYHHGLSVKLANKNSDPYAGWMLVEIKLPTINFCPHCFVTDNSPFSAATHRLGYGSALSKEWTLVNDYDWPHSPFSPSSIICPNICPLGGSSQVRSFFSRTSRIK